MISLTGKRHAGLVRLREVVPLVRRLIGVYNLTRSWLARILRRRCFRFKHNGMDYASVQFHDFANESLRRHAIDRDVRFTV